MAEDQSVDVPKDTQTMSMGDTGAGAADTSLEPAASPMQPMTAERVVDIWLGAVAIGADAAARKAHELSEQAKSLKDDAPEILDAWEQRGRPLREQIVGKIRESFAPIPDEPLGQTPVAEESPAPAAPVAVPPSSPPVVGRSVKREITALEQRVRELEAQVSAPPEAESADHGPTSVPTPAETATFDPEQEHGPATGLSESAYAVSETESELEREEPGEFGGSTFPPAEEA